MKATHYIKRVKESQTFKDFMAEDPKSYLCSLFFIRDFVGPHNETQVDFYSPKKKAMISFKVDKKVERVPINKKTETITHKKFVPKTLNENLKMDVDELKPTLTDEMKNREMTYDIEKVLIFLNIADDRAVWNCTAFLKGLGLLQAHVEDASKSVLFMEKKSLFDLMSFAGAGTGMKPAEGKDLGNLQGVTMIEPKALVAEPQGKAETKEKTKVEIKEEKPESKPEKQTGKAEGKVKRDTKSDK